MQEPTLTNGLLDVRLGREINAHSVDALISLDDFYDELPQRVTLDFSDVCMVKPSGACQLICFLAALTPPRSRLHLHVIEPRETVASYLATLGFFSILNRFAPLQDCGHWLEIEEHRRRRRKDRSRSRPFGVNRENATDRAVVFPMRIIPQQGPEGWTDAFESTCQSFINDAIDVFEQAVESELIEYLPNTDKFWQSNLELYKNIFQHSQSWGLALIVARPQKGTVMTYHDIGIGMRESLAQTVDLRENFSDESAIMWATKEGNTSKPGNSGLGLSLVVDYVNNAGGLLELRSGTCRLRRSNGGWASQSVPRLPGTHVSLFLPAVN